jgi:hypothetical protein
MAEVNPDASIGFLSTKQEAREIRDVLIGRGFLQAAAVVALLQLSPQSPFTLTNLVMVTGW